MKVKICGVTRREDALLAADLGAWAVGFIFHQASPRYISPSIAGDIGAALPPEVLRVGVFVDRSPSEVAEITRIAGLEVIQLHGREDPKQYTSLGLPIIKAVSDLTPVAEDLFSVLVDSNNPGTGTKSDWTLAKELSATHRVILSGGLNPDNIAEGIASVQPAGVDVASGVEVLPGIKDSVLMRQFFAAVSP